MAQRHLWRAALASSGPAGSAAAATRSRSRFAKTDTTRRLRVRSRPFSLCTSRLPHGTCAKSQWRHDCWAGRSTFATWARRMRSRPTARGAHRDSALLEDVHAAGLIHMDVKESNILINDAKEAVLCDFGCATQDMQEATSPRHRHVPGPRSAKHLLRRARRRVLPRQVVGAMKDRLNDQSLHETLEELSRELTHPDPERRAKRHRHAACCPPAALCAPSTWRRLHLSTSDRRRTAAAHVHSHLVR